MAALGHPAFLQALGWATLNSFWQMALLWCLYAVVGQVLNLSSQKKYNLALTGIIIGFCWFVFSFIQYSIDGNSIYTSSFATGFISSQIINQIIVTASVAYLILILFPAYKLLKNWQFIQKLRTQSSHKAKVNYRLFVKKVALQLGIKKPVSVYVSGLIKSPVTIGYIKPIILLPFAALNNLSTQQAEAILLHELSHIKRYDYLINLLVTVIHTLLYFNPFVKQFVKVIEAEREKCCDETVLQFQYDKLSYASALLVLEKQAQVLAMAATGKKHLLNRIEKIVGMEPKPAFKLTRALGAFAALLFVFVINAVLVASKQELPDTELSFTHFANPFYIFDSGTTEQESGVPVKNEKAKVIQIMAKATDNKGMNAVALKTEPVKAQPKITAVEKEAQPVVADKDIVNVAYDLADAALDTKQKEQVKSTVEATKKVLSTLEWTEVEKSIADGMTEEEKAAAKQQYLNEVDKIDWRGLENNLKVAYDNIDWDNINHQLNSALTVIKLDSLQNVYTKIISGTDAERTQTATLSRPLLYPDISIDQLKAIKQEAKKRLALIKAVRDRKIIAL